MTNDDDASYFSITLLYEESSSLLTFLLICNPQLHYKTMKSFGILLSVAFLVCLQTIGVLGFTTPQIHHSVSSSSSTRTGTSLNFGPFSAPKDDGTPGDYVCKVCVSWFYLYSKAVADAG
jgi:hypothetical protein